MASICCSPPESVPATWRDALLQAGKSVNTRCRSCDAAVAAEEGAHHEVLAHGEAIEDPAALGHVADAATDDRRGAACR